MAKVSFIGFVNDWSQNEPKHPAWGMKVGESHRKKTPEGAYETIGTTYWTVKSGWNESIGSPANIDFTSFAKGERVEVFGVSTTETWERDGKKGSNLICKAYYVLLVTSNGQPAQRRVMDDTFDTETPF